jgi:hypothetical protein
MCENFARMVVTDVKKICDGITRQHLVKLSIYPDILFSDEASFNLSGMVSRHNCYYWSNENPRVGRRSESNSLMWHLWNSFAWNLLRMLL